MAIYRSSRYQHPSTHRHRSSQKQRLFVPGGPSRTADVDSRCPIYTTAPRASHSLLIIHNSPLIANSSPIRHLHPLQRFKLNHNLHICLEAGQRHQSAVCKYPSPLQHSHKSSRKINMSPWTTNYSKEPSHRQSPPPESYAVLDILHQGNPSITEHPYPDICEHQFVSA
jgi:hypothetical protein